MARCDTCGNEYQPMLEVSYAGHRFVFDCFECAIHKLAPVCEHCGCRIIGHGVEQEGRWFCCDHCARHTSAEAAHESEAGTA